MYRYLLFIFLLLNNSFSIISQTLDDLSFGTEETLEIATWNIEFFPKNDAITVNLVSQIIENLEIDLWALQEIDDTSLFVDMTTNLEGYEAYFDSEYYGGLVYLYNTNTIEVTDNYEIFTEATYWRPFPRSPQVMEFNYLGEEFVIINNHLKCCGNGTLDESDLWDEETRRRDAIGLLKLYIDSVFPDKKVILLGDLNDSLTDSDSNNVFFQLLGDANYFAADISIAEGSNLNWSFPSYPSHLDHIFITNELFESFESDNSIIETIKLDDFFTGGFSEYDTNVSDHRPVAIKLDVASTLAINEEEYSQSNIMIYPNPSLGITTISISRFSNEGVIQVFNMNGQKVYSTKYINGQNIISIKTSSFPQGIYVVKQLSNNNVIGVSKLVVQN